MPGGAAIVLCFASGYLLAALLLPRFGVWDALFRLSLAAGFGLGIFSAEYTLEIAIGVYQPWRIDLAAFVLLLIAYLLLRSRRTAPAIQMPADAASRPTHNDPTHSEKIVAPALSLTVCAALYAAIVRCFVHPHGEGWDAFAIWNLHARFLFRGGAAWRDGFSPLIPWSHPDYPLLLPAAIAHFWSYLGRESQIVPAAIGLVFTFSTAGVLFSALAIVRGRSHAMLGSLVLLATPFFIENGTSQYADVPLSFFFLAAIALLCLSQRTFRDGFSSQSGLLALSGLAAGFAAWTKNEGLLFVFALAAVLFFALIRRRRHKNHAAEMDMHDRLRVGDLAFFLLGLAPLLILIFWFKHWVAPPGDLFSDAASAMQKLVEPKRYWIVFRSYLRNLLRFGDWWLFPETIALAVFYFLPTQFRRENRRTQPGLRIGLTTLSLTLAGFFLIYVITPYDIFWHLRNSLNRLFLQLWPSAIFLFFLVAPRTVKEVAYLPGVSK